MSDPILKRGDSGPQVAEAQDLLNRNGAILEADGSFGAGTDRALREFQASANLPVTCVMDAATWAALRALPEPSPDIPTRAVAFIGSEEVGGRGYYDSVGSRPTWPGSASGVTIGVGYDMGYQSTFQSDWSEVLPAEQLAALLPWVGIKGEAASGAPAQLTNIRIPWQAAWAVFIHKTLPAQVGITRNAFSKWDAMPRLCFGVLVSLVYNRGSSMVDSPSGSGNRKEMREIRDAVAAGNLPAIPAALRSMQRLWPPTSGLVARRAREAELFEDGLAQASAAAQTA